MRLEGRAMEPSELDFARTYSRMADAQLLDLARDPGSLIDSAWRVLQAELDRRGLKPGRQKTAAQTSERDEPLDEGTETLCPGCGRAVTDPLMCGSCSTMICRLCGTPLDITGQVDDDTDAEGLADPAELRE